MLFLLLRALGPFTLFPRGFLPTPGGFFATFFSSVAENPPVWPSPKLTFAFVCMFSPRCFERRVMSSPNNVERRDTSTPKSLATLAMSLPRNRKLTSLRPPARPLERSLSLPKRSERSTVWAVPPPALSPALVRGPPEFPLEEVWRSLSYSRRFSGFDKTSYAC